MTDTRAPRSKSKARSLSAFPASEVHLAKAVQDRWGGPRTIFLTTAEVADLLRIKIDTLRQMRGRRRSGAVGYSAGPPYCQLSPKKVLYRRDEVCRWIADRERSPSA